MRRGLIVAVTVLAYSALYAPQPLLPLLARRWAVGESEAALLITATLLPLSVAPLSYGLALRRVPPVSLLRVALLVLGALQLAFLVADSFVGALAVRVGMGLALPAVLTATMTYAALSAPPGGVARELAVYVAASIVGGFAGRALSATAAALADWRWGIGALGAGLLLVVPLLGRLPAPAPPTLAMGAGEAPPVPLRRFLPIYLAVFCLFFVFAGLLNFLPFRLVELLGGRDPGVLGGVIYTGYLVGVGTALGSAAIARRIGGTMPAMRVGFALLVASLALVAIPGVAVLFGALFVFCGAMFLVHALATGAVNGAAGAGAGLANGVYLVFYYSGGALGSYLPGLAYERWGWSALVLSLAAVALAGLSAAAAWRPPVADPPPLQYS